MRKNNLCSDTKVISTQVSEKLERRKMLAEIWKQNHPDEPYRSSAMPLEYYIYPRTFNSDVPLTVGRQNAFRALQLDIQKLSMAKKLDENPWSSLGPNNYGGRMRAVAYDPTNSNIVYVGGASGGVWKSYDAGLSWTPISDYLPTLAVGALAVDKNNPNRVFAGTGEGSNNWDRVFGDGVFLSEDGGTNWTNIMTIIPYYDQVCNAIALHPVSSDTLFAAIAYQTGNAGALFKTTDKGKTWVPVLSPGFARDVVIDPFNSKRVFAAMGYDGGSAGNGIYRSDKSGSKFSFSQLSLTNGLPASDSIGRIRIAASPSQPNTFITVMVRANKYISAQAEDLLGIYRTTNGGDNWERMPCSDYADIKKFMSSGGSAQGFYDLYVAFHPTNPNIIFIGGIDNWRSQDFGMTFQKISNSNSVHVDQHAIAFDPKNPNTMIIGNDGGVDRTTNNTAANVPWENGDNNLETFQFYAMDYDKLNPVAVYGGTQDNGTNKGAVGNKNWSHILGGDGMTVCVDPTNSNIIYAESQYGDIRKSGSGGSSFVSIKNGISYSPLPHWVAPFVISPKSSSTLFFGSNIVYRTIDGGSSWIGVSADLTNTTNSFNQITYIAVSKSDPNVVFVVTGNGRCWKSINANATAAAVEWTRVGTGTSPLPSLSFTKVAIDPTDTNRVYVATSSFDSLRNGIYATTDGGNTWQRKVPVGNDGRAVWRYGPCNAIVVSAKKPSTLYVGTDIGVFKSTDYGDTWKPFGKGLPVVVVNDLRLTETDVLYAATHGRCMWMASTIVGVNDYHPTLNSYMLEQNYPNPFGASTHLGSSVTQIAFTIPTRSNVELKVYDLKGKLIRSLTDETRDAGNYIEQFDAKELSSGIFFYELKAGNYHEVKKMILVR